MSETIAIGVLRNARHEILIARRHADAHQGGLWEFPGGRVEPGESVEQALAREFDEELGLRVDASRPLCRISHDYGDRQLSLEVREVTAAHGDAHGREGQAIEWLAAEALWQRDFPAANQAILRALILPPLVAISGTPGDDFEQRIARVLARGAGLVQLRPAGLVVDDADSEGGRLAARVLIQCRAAGARLVLNGTPEVALALGMDGVHLNRERLMALDARPFSDAGAGARMLVGASCHDADELRQARDIGADYALLSPVLATNSHPGAPHLGWPKFTELAAGAAMPVYALGGMDRDSLPLARSHGAHGIALLGALWNP